MRAEPFEAVSLARDAGVCRNATEPSSYLGSFPIQKYLSSIQAIKFATSLTTDCLCLAECDVDLNDDIELLP